MKKFFRTLNATVAASALAASSVFSGAAYAINSVNGSLGTTSTATVYMSVVRTAEVKISGITSDITLGSWTTGSGAVTLGTTLCIYSNATNGAFTIVGTGSGAAGAFTLADATTETLIYSPFIDASGADTGANPIPLSPAAALAQTGADYNSATCGGTNNFQLNIHITSGHMTAAHAGTYTGTIALLVAPN